MKKYFILAIALTLLFTGRVNAQVISLGSSNVDITTTTDGSISSGDVCAVIKGKSYPMTKAFMSNISTLNVSSCLYMGRVSSGKYILVGQSSYNIYMQQVSFNGSSLSTLGSVVNENRFTYSSGSLAGVKCFDNKAYIAECLNGYFRLHIYDVSGSTPTFVRSDLLNNSGHSNTIPSYLSFNSFVITKASPNYAIVAAFGSNGNLYSYRYNYSTGATTILQTYYSGGTTFTSGGVYSHNNKIGVYMVGVGGTYGSGASISNAEWLITDLGSFPCLVQINPNKTNKNVGDACETLISFIDDGYLVSYVNNYVVVSYEAKTFGIAQNAGTSIRIKGKATNMSGLITGEEYIINNGFKQYDGNGIPFGKALSATEFMIY